MKASFQHFLFRFDLIFLAKMRDIKKQVVIRKNKEKAQLFQFGGKKRMKGMKSVES